MQVKQEQARLKHFVISGTMACNLRCVHCYVSAGPRVPDEVTTDELISAIDQASQLGATGFTFTGGEIFLRKDLMDIVKHIYRTGCRVGFETNGTLLTAEILDKLASYDPEMFFAISLDGLNPETHDRFRGKKGAHQRTIESINRLQEYPFKLQLITVMNRLNISEIEPLIEHTQANWRATNRFLVMSSEGRAQQNLNLCLSAEEIQSILESVIFPWMYRTTSVHVDVPVALVPPDLDTASICPSGSSLMGMNEKGDLGLCSRIDSSSELSTGTIRDTTIEEAWDSDLFERQRMVSHKSLKGVCGNCIAAYVCKGRCRVIPYYALGDYYAPDMICQGFYDAGLFPTYALIDSDRDSHYVPIQA